MKTSRLLILPAHGIRELPFALAAFLLAVALILAPQAEAGSVMKQSETEIEMPTNDEVVPLKGMFMGSHQAESVTEITSICLTSLPDEGSEPMKLVWVVTMSNTRPITQVVILKITFRDEHGERLATGRGRLSIATATLDKEYEVKTKISAAAWKSSSKVELHASWIG